MENDDFIDRFYFLKVFFEFDEVWFQHFKKHVVKVILTELKHLVSCSIRLREHFLNIALFC